MTYFGNVDGEMNGNLQKSRAELWDQIFLCRIEGFFGESEADLIDFTTDGTGENTTAGGSGVLLPHILLLLYELCKCLGVVHSGHLHISHQDVYKRLRNNIGKIQD